MRHTRAILLTSAALLAGAAVNVGVAWWRVSRVKVVFSCLPDTPRVASEGWPPHIRTSEYWEPPFLMYEGLVWGARWTGYFCQFERSPLDCRVGAQMVRAGWPCDSLIAVRANANADIEGTRLASVIRALGRQHDPLRVVRSADLLVFFHPTRGNWIEGIDRPGSYEELKGRPNFLPTRPLWPGFAINTVFYAAAVSAPLALFTAVRRWRRRAHGRCPSCAYDLGGLAPGAPCPECGGARP